MCKLKGNWLKQSLVVAGAQYFNKLWDNSNSNLTSDSETGQYAKMPTYFLQAEKYYERKGGGDWVWNAGHALEIFPF